MSEKMNNKQEINETKRKNSIEQETFIKRPEFKTAKNLFTYTNQIANMATQVIVKANNENDYGFDISPTTLNSPYRGKNCITDFNDDLMKLQCAKKKYTSKIGMKLHQDARKAKYRGIIADICKKNKKLACSKYALPDHDICNCDESGMSLSEIIPYAMSFYREVGSLIENNVMSKDDYIELTRKGIAKISSAKDRLKKRGKDIDDTFKLSKGKNKGVELAGEIKNFFKKKKNTEETQIEETTNTPPDKKPADKTSTDETPANETKQ